MAYAPTYVRFTRATSRFLHAILSDSEDEGPAPIKHKSAAPPQQQAPTPAYNGTNIGCVSFMSASSFGPLQCHRRSTSYSRANLTNANRPCTSPSGSSPSGSSPSSSQNGSSQNGSIPNGAGPTSPSAEHFGACNCPDPAVRCSG